MAAATHPTDDNGRTDYSHVPDDARTPDRDRAYREINEWRAHGDWPLSAVEMEDRGEYSAQHYRNVKQYYVDTEPDSTTNGGERGEVIEVVIPGNVESPVDFVQGYLAGLRDRVGEEEGE